MVITIAILMNAVGMVFDRKLCLNTTRGMYLMTTGSAIHVPEIERMSVLLLRGGHDRLDIGQCIKLSNRIC